VKIDAAVQFHDPAPPGYGTPESHPPSKVQFAGGEGLAGLTYALTGWLEEYLPPKRLLALKIATRECCGLVHKNAQRHRVSRPTPSLLI
jgi:hypothetical protein